MSPGPICAAVLSVCNARRVRPHARVMIVVVDVGGRLVAVRVYGSRCVECEQAYACVSVG